MKNPLITLLIQSISMLALTACGGGGGSDSGTVIEGTLTENGGAGHKLSALKHGVGQKIENVMVCALGECSTTDSAGQWGFLAPSDFNGGAVLFTLNGHGISTTATFNVPAGAQNVVLDLQHLEGGVIQVYHITIDGEETHLEPEDDDHGQDTEEEHEHQGESEHEHG